MKSLPGLLRGITSNHNGDFYYLNYFHSFSTKNRLKKHERVCNNHDYCKVEMPNEDNKTLGYNHGEKPLKVLFLLVLTQNFCYQKSLPIKIIPKNLIQRKKLSIHLQVTHGLHVVCLMHQKTKYVITKGETVWKSFVETLETR